MAGGAASSMLSAAFAGGDGIQIVGAGIQGAVIGGMTAAATAGIMQGIGNIPYNGNHIVGVGGGNFIPNPSMGDLIQHLIPSLTGSAIGSFTSGASGAMLGGTLMNNSMSGFVDSNSANMSSSGKKISTATKYEDIKESFYYIRHSGSSNTKNMRDLFNFPGNDRVQITFENGVYFDYYEDALGIPQNLKFFSPVNGKLFGFRAENTIKENFPGKNNVTRPYAIRIQGYVNGKYPHNLGTIYFPDWDMFFNFAKYVFLGK